MSHTSGTKAAWATGGLIFAATMMLIVGIFQVLMGIAAVVKHTFFLAVGNNYVYQFGTITWGWIHIGIGAAVIITGLALLSGSVWARSIGIAIAVISAVSNFFFVPYYPLWALLLIALNIFAIWGMATAREPGRRSSMPYQAEGRAMTEPQAEAGQRWPTTNQPADYDSTAETGRRRASDLADRPQTTAAPDETDTPAGRMPPRSDRG